ncbi:MAG TPA: hypothetical protein PKZ84_08385 [Anaerolineae bacterium]|nr:hypothetical protein [Anaerolineae bacterium]HQI84400.1 hypothetical protein [Anaerolineae bacterium]
MKRFVIILAIAALVFAIVPYAVAWARTDPGKQFVGYVYNPADGASYLVKMRLGWLGQWRFRLMFTPEKQTGAYLFLFHLGLGRLARWLGAPLAVIYHAARLLGGVALLAALGWLCQIALPEGRARRWGYAFALFGGGIGWAFIWTAPLPVDVWVPEGYVFYSILANAHFPWAQVLLLLTLALTALWHSGSIRTRYALPAMALMLIALGVLQPFAVGHVGLVWGVWLIFEWITQRRIPWQTALALGVVGAAGLLYPVYGVLAIQRDPVLAAWNAQNVTTSPPWWNWLIGYALTLPWAVPGAVRAWRAGRPLERMLVAWAVGSLLGMVVPISLQRRLSLGLSIPLGALAGLGWGAWLDARGDKSRWVRLAKVGMTLFLALTPLFLLTTGFINPAQAPQRFYISAGELEAAQVLLREGPSRVILAAPERGEALPWLTGHPVVVGHPMETVDFSRREADALRFFDGSWDAEKQRAFLCREGVDYVWIGPVERALGGVGVLLLPGARLVVENADVRLYAVEGVCQYLTRN